MGLECRNAAPLALRALPWGMDTLWMPPIGVKRWHFARAAHPFRIEVVEEETRGQVMFEGHVFSSVWDKELYDYTTTTGEREVVLTQVEQALTAYLDREVEGLAHWLTRHERKPVVEEMSIHAEDMQLRAKARALGLDP